MHLCLFHVQVLFSGVVTLCNIVRVYQGLHCCRSKVNMEAARTSETK
jgi:hypothetical protein